MDRTLLVALDERDEEAAKRFIEDEPDPARVLAMYHGAIRHLYWSAKDIVTLVAVGRCAIAFGTNHNVALKPILYDIGSFLWPGWNEPGIEISDEARTFGADASRKNLELTVELNGSPSALAHAHWLVGAHELARGDRSSAATSFKRARGFASAAGDKATELLADGYVAIAHRRSWDEAPFDSVEERDDLVQQLRTAERLFGH